MKCVYNETVAGSVNQAGHSKPDIQPGLKRNRQIQLICIYLPISASQYHIWTIRCAIMIVVGLAALFLSCRRY